MADTELRESRHKQMRAIRNVIVSTGIPFKTTEAMGFCMHHRTYTRLFSKFEEGGIDELIKVKSVGRLPASVTHPETLRKLREHARADDQSVQQNKRHWKRKGDDVREAYLPKSQILLSSKLQHTVTRGGRKSVAGLLSSSTLRKNFPADIVSRRLYL